MKCALIALSDCEARVALQVAPHFPGAELYVHETVSKTVAPKARRYQRIVALTAEIFGQYRGLVYFAPCVVVVRALAPNVKHKLTDPAVVVVDGGGRYAVSLLSGHEGGANQLALQVANAIGAEPVISTTTEALKTVIVGIGCRRGIKAAAIIRAVRSALREVAVRLDEVRLLASADIKSDEKGLLEAAGKLGVPIRFITSAELRATTRAFQHSAFVQNKVNLPAVAEPAALLAGRRTRLLLPKRAYHGVTVAVAREDCPWSGSAPAVRSTAPAARKRPSRRAK
jgi:cobalt-precorrin 5A hydrolase